MPGDADQIMAYKFMEDFIMKKRIVSLALAAMLSVAALSANVSAAENGGSCNGNHGPWITSCDGYTYAEAYDDSGEPYTHTFYYKGYKKTCTYVYVRAYTNKECKYCGYFEYHCWSHSHGYRGHSDECGWINGDDSTCYL